MAATSLTPFAFASMLTTVAVVSTGIAADSLWPGVHFDSGSEGWVGDVADGSVSWVGSGGNRGGYMEFDDSGAASSTWLLAPADYLGDWSSFDQAVVLRFDFNVIELFERLRVPPALSGAA